MAVETKFYNASTGIVTTLAAAMTAGATSLTVASSGSLTATTGTDQFYALIYKANVPASREVVLVTNISGVTWTVTRAQAGTSAVSHDAGDGVEPVMTAEALEDLLNVYQGATLIVGTRDLDFDSGDFSVTESSGKAVVTLAPTGTPQVGNDVIWDAKGDLAAGTGADMAVRVAVGTNGQVLQADSTQTAGIKWADLAAGAAFAAPDGAIDIGDSNTEGVAVTTVRSDHTHSFPAPAANYPLDVAAAEGDGTATTPARSDHVHAHGSGYLPDAHHARAHDHSNASDTTGLVPAALQVTAGPVLLSGDISPAQLTASVNDYNPAGLATATVLRLTADAEWSITGLQGGADGRLLVLANVGSNAITLADESGSSTAAYRFALDVPLALTADTAATLLYDSTTSRWRLIGIGKASAASTSALAADTLWDAKGDLVAGTGANTAGKVTVGANGTYLKADSGQATGVTWTDPLASPTLTGTATLSQALALTGDISPAQLTGDVNDYAPAGFATASVLRLTSDAARNITGLAGGADGRLIVLANVGAQNIILQDDDAGSTAGNRFALDGDLTLGADTAATLLYDATSSRWRLLALGKTAPGGGGDVATDAIWDAKGDLAGGTGANTASRLAVGTNGQVLTADSGEATGLKWATSSGGSFSTRFAIDQTSLAATYGDDFDEGSLNARWTRQGTNMAASKEQYAMLENNSWLISDLDATNAVQLYLQTAPAGDFELVLTVREVPGGAGNDTMIGPVIVDSSGNGICGMGYSNSHDLYIINLGTYAFSSFGATISGLGATLARRAGQTVWYGLNKTGTAYKVRISLDGKNWSAYTSTTTWAGTVNRIGFGRVGYTLPKQHVLLVDRFNVI